MFNTVLIANRGEIALRVIRTCRRLGIRTVAVYSDADAHAAHVKAADIAVHLGPAPAAESYLRIDKVIAAAQATGAQAIHPGYGFLSENAEFSAACEAAGIVFLGPGADAIRTMGDKITAKQAVSSRGVPLVPGTKDAAMSDEALVAASADIGFPVLIKPSAGGGGKGMHAVFAADQLPEAPVVEVAVPSSSEDGGSAHRATTTDTDAGRGTGSVHVKATVEAVARAERPETDPVVAISASAIPYRRERNPATAPLFASGCVTSR